LILSSILKFNKSISSLLSRDINKIYAILIKINLIDEEENNKEKQIYNYI